MVKVENVWYGFQLMRILELSINHHFQGINIFMKKIFIPLIVFSMTLLTPVSAFSFDHNYGLWDQFLKEHVKSGLVDYETIKKSPKDFTALVKKIEGVALEEYQIWPDKEKKAFWINAYNIGAIKMVLDHYPLRRTIGLQAIRFPAESIQQISGVWEREVFNIMGKGISLNYIENNLLREEFKDPRIHFAIVCASRGCPVLRDVAYTAETLEVQLDHQVHLFLSDRDKFQYDAESDTLYLSHILEWFQEDFERVGGIVSFIRKYIPQDMSLKITEQSKKQWLDYDWSLNKQ